MKAPKSHKKMRSNYQTNENKPIQHYELSPSRQILDISTLDLKSRANYEFRDNIYDGKKLWYNA